MSFNFGAPATTATTGFGFSSTTSFGAPQQNPPAFGAPQTNVPSFGTPQTSAPTVGGLQSNVSAFGIPQTNAPAFGTLPTSTPAFGAIQPTQTSAPAFGFGTTTAVQPQSTTPAFGIITTTTTTAAVAPSFGFAPAVPVPTTQPPAFGSFGLSSTTVTQPSLPTLTATPATTTTTLGFAPLAKPAASVTFGATTSTALPSFGLGATTTMNPMSATTATPGTGFNFTAPTGQLSFGATTATTSSTDGGLFGAKTTPGLSFNQATSTTAFGTSTVTTSTAPKVGLGGFDISASQPKLVEGRSESVRAKDSQMPQEILSTVESLKSHIKQQKTMSSNIARTSTRKLFNVSKELQNCDLKLSEISNYVANNYAAVKALRQETAVAIRQAEMAQRTHETPPGLQFENTAPLKYFLELVHKFEADMLTFRNQVTLTEKHIRSLTNPQGFSTADDLKKGLQEMHESFIALAGRVHETHQKVEALKEQYLNLRKHKLKDNSNVFEEKQTAANISSSSMGPTPFSTLAGNNLSMSYGPHQVRKST
ncbi:nuclear pore complex protein Nup58 isoform X3 [Bradysia coprophila]|uniref:nuclear pore complex protein Nup58 isoform X3 n=1 Tax=Bradysia coprophila TaxID=38358 RepID=UPI00187DCCC0|nr:nuclear pore complex protein Nup58 isoform X3 [Bradysia coprophila]